MSASESPRASRHVLSHDQTLAGYDRWAASYDATDNPMVAATAWALQNEPLDVQDAAVVELGCGTGRHADPALRSGARTFTGVDGSTGMLQRARAAFGDDRIRWQHGEVHATGLPSAAFDVVLIVLVFEHLRDLTPICREAARLLRRGGRLRVLEIHPDLLANGTNAHFHDSGVEHRFTSVHHDVASIRGAIDDAGFTITRAAEHRAEGKLLRAVPRLSKHAGRLVLLDVAAQRG